MKSSIFIILVLITYNLMGQEPPDLIITTKGDSIQCWITNMSESEVYFNVPNNKKITPAKISRMEVNSIQQKHPGALIVSSGFGFPDLLYMGMRYQFEKVQLGLSVGTIPGLSQEQLLSITSDIRFPIGSKLKRNPSYVRAGLNYIRDETKAEINKYWHMHSRIGKSFVNKSNRFGLELDGGFMIELSHQETKKTPNNSWVEIDSPVIAPSFSISIFHKL